MKQNPLRRRMTRLHEWVTGDDSDLDAAHLCVHRPHFLLRGFYLELVNEANVQVSSKVCSRTEQSCSYKDTPRNQMTVIKVTLCSNTTSDHTGAYSSDVLTEEPLTTLCEWVEDELACPGRIPTGGRAVI